jgi:hypothetical protein
MPKKARTSKRRPSRSKGVVLQPPPKRSAAKLKRIKQAAEKQIDDFMKQIGCPDPSERTDEQGWRWFEYRSARGRAGILESESNNEMYLRVESLGTELPPDKEQALRFMREILQTNMTIPGPTRMGLSDENVYVCATIPASTLSAGDVPEHIHSVMAIAASYTNPFAETPRYEPPSAENTPSENVSEPGPQTA